MQYYEYDNDCSVAGIGRGVPIGDQLDEIFDCNEPVASRWKPIRLSVLDKRTKEAGDFPVLYNCPDIPVFSQRAWDVLSGRIACRWEALPIIHPSKKPFYLVHVMEVIDCVDHAVGDRILRRWPRGEHQSLLPKARSAGWQTHLPNAYGQPRRTAGGRRFSPSRRGPQAQGPGVSRHTESPRIGVKEGDDHNRRFVKSLIARLDGLK